jgi:predicted nucleotidyltransferase
VSAVDPLIYRFAERLRDEIGAEQVLLFGSYARGNAYHDSDYDFIIVSPRFRDIPKLQRTFGLRDLFYELGGDAPMDLICVTPEEFERAKSRVTLIAAVLPESIDLLAPAAV